MNRKVGQASRLPAGGQADRRRVQPARAGALAGFAQRLADAHDAFGALPIFLPAVFALNCL